MFLRRAPLFLLIVTTFVSAGIIDEVRGDLSNNDIAAAKSALETYRARKGATPEYLEALSWMGRDALAEKRLDEAETYAKQTETLVKKQLGQKSLDSVPNLPIALGASFEVQAQVMAARGQKPEAIAFLKHAITTYSNTSIVARLQKNLNLIGMTGQAAPPIDIAKYLGTKPTSLAQLKGSPVLLFFWAHWCGDCKAEGPIITRLRSEFATKGLKVVAPTQLYGYAAGGEDATPSQENDYIGQIWSRYYSGLQDAAVPVSKENFDRYGASTTPTVVLVDRAGTVSLYHPGAMSYEELRSAIVKVTN